MLGLITGALAATPVVALGPGDAADAVSAVDEVAARTGIPPAELVPVDLGPVLAAGVVGAEVSECAGPRLDRRELEARLQAVVREYDAGLVAEASAHAGHLTDAVCLADLLDRDWAWSASFTAGAIAWASGDPEAARAAWSRARALDPRRGWDDDFAPEGGALDLFASSMPVGTPAPLRVLGGSFAVDGRLAPVEVAPGPHVLQAGEPLRTWWVGVSGPVVAVHPDLEPAAVASDPAALAAVLAVTHPGAEQTFVVDGDEVLRVDLSAGVIDPVPPAPPPLSPGRRRARVLLLGAGGVLVTGALVNTLSAWPLAVEADQQGVAASDRADWVSARAAYVSALTRLGVGYGVAGLGGGLVIVGAVDLVRGR